MCIYWQKIKRKCKKVLTFKTIVIYSLCHYFLTLHHMKQSITLPREIQVAGYKATINIKFVTYDEWKRYYCSVSETAKAIKAIAKEAWLTVLACKSESYSWWDNVNITIKSELTTDQKATNNKCFYTNDFNYTKEPKQELIDMICGSFKSGSFNSMEDIYEYWKDSMTVEGPNWEHCSLDTKYCFNRFE